MKPWFLEADYITCPEGNGLVFQAVSRRGHSAFEALGASLSGTLRAADPKEAIAVHSRLAGLKGHFEGEAATCDHYDADDMRQWAELASEAA
ncbi:MAG: hypothetical protein AB1508_01030 [Pseudomonadota bacterium]